MPPPTNQQPPDPITKLHGLDWQLEHLACGNHETMALRDVLRGLIDVITPMAQRPANWREQPAREANGGVVAPQESAAEGPPVFDESGALVSGTFVSGRSTVVITSPPRPPVPPAPAPATPAATATPTATATPAVAASPPASRVIDIGAILAAPKGTPLADLAQADGKDDAEERFSLLDLERGKAG